MHAYSHRRLFVVRLRLWFSRLKFSQGFFEETLKVIVRLHLQVMSIHQVFVVFEAPSLVSIARSSH